MKENNKKSKEISDYEVTLVDFQVKAKVMNERRFQEVRMNRTHDIYI